MGEQVEADEQQFIVSRKNSMIFLKVVEDFWFDEVEITFELWQLIVPIAMDPEAADDLLALEPVDDVSFDVTEDLRSLFRLSFLLSWYSPSPMTAKLAEAWNYVSMRKRLAWTCESSSDKPIHAQILGQVWPTAELFSRHVPVWLPWLLEATEEVFQSDLFWTRAFTQLGTTCVAFLTDKPEDLHACLALSSCPIKYELVDDENRLSASRAVEDLRKRLDMLNKNRVLAEAIDWRVTGHELLDMSDTLRVWQERIQSQGDGHACVA